jgi:hypothetical protein
MGKPLSVTVEAENFYRAVRKYMTLATKEQSVIIREAAETFIAAAQRHTPPLNDKQPSAKIKKEKYLRHVRSYKDGRVSVNIRKRKKFFKDEKEAKPYRPISYRGLSRAGWFLRAEIAGLKLTAAMQGILKKSPSINNQPGSNAIDVKTTADHSTAVIVNNVRGIEGYARIAEAQGYRSAAHSFNAGYRRLKKKLSGELG